MRHFSFYLVDKGQDTRYAIRRNSSFLFLGGLPMALSVKVDDHEVRETPRENGLTVRGAIKNAYKDGDIPLRSQSLDDTVKVNGQPSSYGHMITRQDGNNAHVEVETDRYRAERAAAAEKSDPLKQLHSSNRRAY
jgi:hypothetical protein